VIKDIQPGQKVVIDGASGGVGTFAVQIAKSFGAEVTAVCSTSKVDTARRIGADHVIDYTREDFTQSGQRYDLILGANVHHSIFDYMRALSQNEFYVVVGGGLARILQAMLLGTFIVADWEQENVLLYREYQPEGFGFSERSSCIWKSCTVIDRRYPLSDAAEALRYLEERHARGKVILTVEHSDGT